MSIRTRLAKFLLGVNPNSYANLKQNQPKEILEPVQRKQSDEDFIDKMQRYEKLRQDIYNTEQQKRQSIMQELQEQLGDDDYEEDNNDSDAIQMFMQILQQERGGQGQSAPVATMASTQATHQAGLSDDDIRNIISTITQEHPSILKRVRTGKISKEQAVSFLKLRGVSEVDATRIYEKAMSDEE